MRTGLCLLVAVLLASPASAQTASLPIERHEAQSLSKEALAQLVFGAAADGVVASRADAVYMGDTIAQVTFLLRPRPAVDDYLVHYAGACSIRRIRVDLDMADGGRTVEDLTTDTAWAVLGPMSVIEPRFDFVAGQEDPEATARAAACEGWSDFQNIVEAPNASSLRLATDALSALPALLDGNAARVTCDDAAPCDETHRAALRTGRLTDVGPCDDPEFLESLGVRQEQTCVTLVLLLPGGGAFQYDTLNVTAAGEWDISQRFVPSRVWMGVGTTIVD